MRSKSVVLAVIAASLAFAADPPKAPEIPADLQTEVAWAVADAAQAELNSMRANAKKEALIAKANAVCGQAYEIQRSGPSGSTLTCVAKDLKK